MQCPMSTLIEREKSKDKESKWKVSIIFHHSILLFTIMVDKMELRNNFFSTSFPRVPLFPLWPKGPVETDPETTIFTRENRNILDRLLALRGLLKTPKSRHP